MAHTYKIILANKKEFKEFASKDPRYAGVTEENLGFADPLKRIAYVQDTLWPELNRYLIDHEFEHLLEEHGTDEDEFGIRHKRGLFGGGGGGFIPRILSAIPGVSFVRQLVGGDVGGAFRTLGGSAVRTLGTAFGGPLGAIAGNAAGGAIEGGGRGALTGGLTGLAGGALGPALGRTASGATSAVLGSGGVGGSAARGLGGAAGTGALRSAGLAGGTGLGGGLGGAFSRFGGGLQQAGRGLRDFFTGTPAAAAAAQPPAPLSEFSRAVPQPSGGFGFAPSALGMPGGAGTFAPSFAPTASPLSTPFQSFRPVAPGTPISTTGQGGLTGQSTGFVNAPNLPPPTQPQPSFLDRFQGTTGIDLGQEARNLAGNQFKSVLDRFTNRLGGGGGEAGGNVPDFGGLPSVQDLRAQFGENPLRGIALEKLGGRLGESFTGVDPLVEQSIRRSFDNKRRLLASQFKMFRPNADIATDSEFRQAMLDIDREEAETMAQSTQQAQNVFNTQRGADIAQALGIDTNTLQALTGLAGLDVDRIALQMGIDRQRAAQLHNTVGQISFLLGR